MKVSELIKMLENYKTSFGDDEVSVVCEANDFDIEKVSDAFIISPGSASKRVCEITIEVIL